MTGNATARFIQTVELVKCLADEASFAFTPSAGRAVVIYLGALPI